MCRSASTRRDFLQQLVIGPALAGSILALASRRAAWAQAQAPGAPAGLFDIQRVADGVYFAFAKPQAVTNCNAVIFVNSADVVVVDAHSKPSAAASLINQIRAEITSRPVRYLVDTHFHFDHTQGNGAYRETFGDGLKIVASRTTRRLQEQFTGPRLRQMLDPAGHPPANHPHVPELLDAARRDLAAARTPEEKSQLNDRIGQLEAFQREMQNFTPTLPTVTFGKRYVIRDKAHDLHVEFHGRGHTGGDVVVFCPQKRVVATGDLVIGTMPYLGDSFPKAWPKTIDSVAKLDFDYVTGGHGALQHGRRIMTCQRDYIEELAGKVELGKGAGKSLKEVQESMPVASIRSLQADGYGEFIRAGRDEIAMRSAININIEHAYNRLEAGVR
jgi:glyoxylase-like metal-dependent hydrolase (beta-lactamase superfamily II)